MGRKRKGKQPKVDQSVDMSFPASDPPASGRTTGTEAPKRPIDREAPVTTREQIERAQRGEGHKQGTRRG
jgi:hypothetical protein